jgi:hypothetical protein
VQGRGRETGPSTRDTGPGTGRKGRALGRTVLTGAILTGRRSPLCCRGSGGGAAGNAGLTQRGQRRGGTQRVRGIAAKVDYIWVNTCEGARAVLLLSPQNEKEAPPLEATRGFVGKRGTVERA